MKLFSLDFGFGSVLLLIVLALLAAFGPTGCTGGDRKDQTPEQVAADTQATQAKLTAWSQFLKSQGLFGVAVVHGDPATGFYLVNGFKIDNGSGIDAFVMYDPLRADLQRIITEQRTHE